MYYSIKTQQLEKLGSLMEDELGSLDLTIVVPAYNEEARITPMLEEVREYLLARSKTDRKFTYEIIVVNDGSMDGTSRVVMELSKTFRDPNIKVLDMIKNRERGCRHRGISPCKG